MQDERQQQSRFQSDSAARTTAHPERSARPGFRAKRYPAVSSMICRQKSSCRDEYSISSGRKIACRISSLLTTRPAVRAANSRASVLLPLPGSPAIKTIIKTMCKLDAAAEGRYNRMEKPETARKDGRTLLTWSRCPVRSAPPACRCPFILSGCALSGRSLFWRSCPDVPRE